MMIFRILLWCQRRLRNLGRKKITPVCLGGEVLELKFGLIVEMSNLKGLFWNSEGFRDPGKHLFVKEIIRERKLDFIALSETGRSNFSTPFLTHLAVGFVFHLEGGRGAC